MISKEINPWTKLLKGGLYDGFYFQLNDLVKLKYWRNFKSSLKCNIIKPQPVFWSVTTKIKGKESSAEDFNLLRNLNQEGIPPSIFTEKLLLTSWQSRFTIADRKALHRVMRMHGTLITVLHSAFWRNIPLCFNKGLTGRAIGYFLQLWDRCISITAHHIFNIWTKEGAGKFFAASSLSVMLKNEASPRKTMEMSEVRGTSETQSTHISYELKQYQIL